MNLLDAIQNKESTDLLKETVKQGEVQARAMVEEIIDLMKFSKAIDPEVLVLLNRGIDQMVESPMHLEKESAQMQRWVETLSQGPSFEELLPKV